MSTTHGTSKAYTPNPIMTFFGIIMSGMVILTVLRMGGGGSNFEQQRIMMGSNTAGVILSAIIVAVSVEWAVPLFLKVALVHILSAAGFGYFTMGKFGFGTALGSSIPFGLMTAAVVWIMVGGDWIIGKIVFWGLAALTMVSLLMYLAK